MMTADTIAVRTSDTGMEYSTPSSPKKERQERRIIRRDMRFVRKERRAVQTKKAADAIRSGRPIENVLRLKQRAGQPPVPRAGGGDAAADAVLPLCQKCGKRTALQPLQSGIRRRKVLQGNTERVKDRVEQCLCRLRTHRAAFAARIDRSLRGKQRKALALQARKIGIGQNALLCPGGKQGEKVVVCGKCRRVDLPRRISSSIRILRFCMQIPHECGHRVACEQIK